MSFFPPRIFSRGTIVLVVLGLIAFLPSVRYDLVNWDDLAYVTHNDLIKGWSAANLAGIATETVTRNYAPITIFSFLIDHTLWGLAPTGYHLTNVILHLVNGVLVFFLLDQLTKNRGVAWTAAALFLVHPVQIESVAWVSSRKGLLCAAFMLSACIVRMRKEVSARQDGWYIGLLVAALLSKALAVVLPPIIFVYDVVIGRQRVSDAAVRQVIPAFFSALLLLHTMGAQNTVLGGVRGHMTLPLWHIIAVDVTILWQYIGMLFWPADLCVLYAPATTGIALPVFAGSLGWIAVGFVLWRARADRPLAVLGAAAFLLLLFPVLNFFRITTLMNDRYLYLPCIPVFAGAAWLLSRAVEALMNSRFTISANVVRRAGQCVAGCAIAGALMTTMLHLPVWQNSMSLWTHAIQQQPEIPVVRIQMALTLHDRGQVRDALNAMVAALEQTSPDAGDRRRMEHAIEQWRSELETRRTAYSSINQSR